MIESIKEAIILYAPTVLCCVSSFVGFFKTAKQLKENAKDISESATISKLRKEIKDLRETLSCQTRYQIEIIKQNKELLQNEKHEDKEV